MKKSFNSWKLLTLLSSLIFAMSCWYIVYAAAGFKVPGGIWMELDSSEWNEVVDYLVPSWAVMAFNLSSCPDWWTEYTAARDRTIRGKGYYNSAGDTGGSDYIYLSEYDCVSHETLIKWLLNNLTLLSWCRIVFYQTLRFYYKLLCLVSCETYF